jgi:hypothetical protein
MLLGYVGEGFSLIFVKVNQGWDCSVFQLVILTIMVEYFLLDIESESDYKVVW